MKKIYMILAAMTLLSMSLNAQLKVRKNGTAVPPKSSTEKVEKEVTKPDGYFRMGPSRASNVPVTPPYSNGFSNSTEWDWWETIDVDGDGSSDGKGQWTLSDNQARYKYHSTDAANDWLVTAPITLKAGKSYKVSFDATASTYFSERLEVKLASSNTASALSSGTTVIESTTFNGSRAFSNENVTVDTDGNYYIGIHAISDADMYNLYVDNFNIDVEADPIHDLSVALSAPAQAGAGSTVTVTATVTNNGNFAENGYTVTFTANGNVISTQTATEALAIGATATFTAQYPTNAADAGQTVNFTANVTCADDADATNNNATASTSVITMPAPENVAATATGSNATMTWDAPSNLPTVTTTVNETVTEGFDDTNVFPSFSIGGITATQHTGTIGDWTVYTPSSDYVYGPQNVTFTNDNDPQAWAVMNPTAASWNIGSAHSGSQFMISFCDAGDENGDNIQTTDHWLISPELSGNAQTISFWERVITTQYGNETYEVLASSTDNNPASFSLVESFTSNATSWTQRTASLPAGTKYFAIRHTAYDIFGVMIDDVTYEISNVVETQLAPESYNIYLDGQLVGYVDANTFSYTFNNVSGEHECAVSAVYPGGIESAAVPVTIPALPQTAAPTIAISSQTDNQVTITATGNGTVTLTINGQTVEGNGSASITVPRQMQDYVVSASATAQVSGELVSETTTQNLTIPGMASSGEWTEMTGTYDPDDLLSFQVKVGNDTTDIMLIDQFMASTVHNDHPNGYTYVLKETIDGVEMASNPVNVPVYKTNSNLNGFYTEAQVIADNKYDENKLTAHTLNTQIEYDVVPDNNVLYYSLYRGEKNEQRPVIDVDHRISQLQKFEDKVDGNVMYYFNENHQQGVLPKYEHIGSQTAERLDMNYVTGTGEDELSYVPVIWTFGLYTARGDGKNNSYGSDIKHSYVGKVNISVEGLKNDGDYTTGQWKDPNGTTYCVYSPIITLGGVTPDDGGANDGDTYQYVPYMYRVWCTYPNAHNFTLLANPDGKVHLADAGAITAPFLIGEVTAEDTEAWNGTGEEVKIGRALESGEAQQPWSFGVPVNESSSNVQFVARFYYKKIVTPGAQVNGLRGTRDNDEAAFAIAENSDDGQGIVTGINELADIVYVVSTTYVNAQGMQSDKPFDGLNIVVTRYSDGTTRTTKLVR